MPSQTQHTPKDVESLILLYTDHHRRYQWQDKEISRARSRIKRYQGQDKEILRARLGDIKGKKRRY